MKKTHNLVSILLCSIGIIGMVLVLTTLSVSAEERRVELTCISVTGKDYHYTLGEIDPSTGFLVEELRMSSKPYILLKNPEDEYETLEKVWSSGWECLLERYVKQ